MGWLQVELTGTKNGVNKTFTFPSAISGDAVMVVHNNAPVTIIESAPSGKYWHLNYWHGNYWHGNYWPVSAAGNPPLVAGECHLAGATITMGTAPNAGDRLIGWAKTGA